jgi:hypothetical protein
MPTFSISKPALRTTLLICVIAVSTDAHAAIAPHAEAAQAVVGNPAHLTIFGASANSARNAAGLSRLDGALAEVALRYPSMDHATALSALHAINPAARFRLAPPLAAPEVLIDAVSLGDPGVLAAALENLGLEKTAVFSNDVGGWLPVDQLSKAAAIAGLHHIRASMPRTRAGAVTSQGDFAAGSNLIRSNSNLTGSGVTVGVLSDSFNCYAAYAMPGSNVPASGNAGYASNGFTADAATDVSTGDLSSSVKVLEEADCLNYGAPEQLPFSDEGRAILQIVHDVAPGAGLAFYTATGSEADFAKGIGMLASSAGAKVIDDDIGYQDEPFFQDGLVAQAVNQVEAQGVAYFSSAGNDGSNAYDNNAPSFPVTASSGANASEMLLNFDASGRTQTTSLPLTIPALSPGEFLFLELAWDQPYVTGAPNSGGATNSLDLCVSGNSADALTDLDGNSTACTGANAVGADPIQILVIGNPANATGNTAQENISITIGLASGAVPGRIKFLLADNGAGATINAFQTNSASIQGHPGAAGAATVGAAFYLQTPPCGTSPAVLEAYSSIGGDPILFDTSGNRLAAPVIRQKPDFVAPDGVNNTFLGFPLSASDVMTSITGCQNQTSYPSFFGTSAAAPHAAATAALMLQANASDTPSQIYAAFRNSASPMGGASGFNYDSGYGFIQADAAFLLLPAGSSGAGSSTGSGSGGSTTGSGSGSGSFDGWSLTILGGLLVARKYWKAGFTRLRR